MKHSDRRPYRRPLRRIDGRSQIGIAVRKKRLGDSDDYAKHLARSAAELAVLAAEARAKALRGAADLDDVIRAEMFAQRALNALGLSGGVLEAESVTLASYLKRR
jgi:hypothetical protein